MAESYDMIKEKYNSIVGRGLNFNGKPSEFLNSLTDQELYYFIVGKTLIFGRSLEKSIKNARAHLENRAECIKLFTKIDIEKGLL